MPRSTRSKARGKQQQGSATAKKEAEVNKKPAVENVITTRKRGAVAPVPELPPPKMRKKEKTVKPAEKKQSAKQTSASNQITRNKKKNETVQDKVEEPGEVPRATRSRMGVKSVKKVPAPILPAPTKTVRTRSMQRKRTESPKKKALTEAAANLRTSNSNKVVKKQEVEAPVPKNKKSPKKPAKTTKPPTKPQSKMKTKAKKVTIKKTTPSKPKSKSRTRKLTSQKPKETVESTIKSESKVQQRGRRSTQRSEVAKTPAEKKSVTRAITRPRRRMHKNTEDDKKEEEETQMEKTENEGPAAEETKPNDEADVSPTAESKIDDPKEQTKADHQEEQTEMEVVGTDDDNGVGKRKLDEEKEENVVKKAKMVDECDKEASLKEDEEMDLGTEGKLNEQEGLDKSNEKSSIPAADEAAVSEEVKMDEVETKPEQVEKKGEEEPEKEKEEETSKANDVVENDKEATEKLDESVEPTISKQTNCQTVTETPPEKLLAAEDATTEDEIPETPVENSTPTTNGVLYENKESLVMIGRRKFVQNAHVEDKEEDAATKHKFSVASYNMENIEESKAKQDVEEMDADIICFQQVESDYYTNTLQPHMKTLGYVGFYHEGKNDQKGLATFCKTTTFEFVDKKECDIYQLVKKDIEDMNLEDVKNDALTSFLSKNASSALYIKLKSATSQKTMCVCNTSLSPADHGLHALQLAVLVKELTSQSEGTENPHLLCGTLNLKENNPGFQVVKDGYLNEESILCLQGCRDVPIPGKEHVPLVDLLWKCFQHSSSGFKNSYSLLSKENAPLNIKNSVWHSSDSLRVMGVLDLEIDGNTETSDNIPLYVQFNFN